MHNYHDVYNSLPAGRAYLASSGDGNRGRWSALLFLMPYIEQMAIYDAITAQNIWTDPGGTRYCYPWEDGKPNALFNDALHATIDALMCPSDGNGLDRAVGSMGRTNYVISSGDYAVHTNDASGRSRGAFATGAWHGLSALSDGTSNTALMSERVISSSGRYVKESYAAAVTPAVFASNAAGGCETELSALSCLNSVNNGKYDTAKVTTVRNDSGYRWQDAATSCTWMNTILPPNSPSCVSSNNDDTPMLLPPTSNHTGGVQVLRGDASVSFVSNTINAGTLTETGPLCVRGGASPFGVWGAFGSRNGGESVAP